MTQQIDHINAIRENQQIDHINAIRQNWYYFFELPEHHLELCKYVVESAISKTQVPKLIDIINILKHAKLKETLVRAILDQKVFISGLKNPSKNITDLIVEYAILNGQTSNLYLIPEYSIDYDLDKLIKLSKLCASSISKYFKLSIVQYKEYIDQILNMRLTKNSKLIGCMKYNEELIKMYPEYINFIYLDEHSGKSLVYTAFRSNKNSILHINEKLYNEEIIDYILSNIHLLNKNLSKEICVFDDYFGLNNIGIIKLIKKNLFDIRETCDKLERMVNIKERISEQRDNKTPDNKTPDNKKPDNKDRNVKDDNISKYDIFLKEQTKDICLHAVKQNGYNIRYVNDIIIDLEIAIEAVNQNDQSLEHVPERYQKECKEFLIEKLKLQKGVTNDNLSTRNEQLTQHDIVCDTEIDILNIDNLENYLIQTPSNNCIVSGKQLKEKITNDNYQLIDSKSKNKFRFSKTVDGKTDEFKCLRLQI